MNDEEYDDELLAPPSDVLVDPAPVLDDPSNEPDVQWHASHGYPDSRMAVRVWMGERPREVIRVHVSPRWREVLGPNRSLAGAFQEALFAASVQVGGPDPFRPEPDEVGPDADSSLTWADLDAVQERLRELQRRAAELRRRSPDEVRSAVLEGEQAVATRGPVTVTLSWYRDVESVSFDRQWLAGATADQIENWFMQAVRAAYEAYVEPTFVPGEHEELATEMRRVDRDLTTIMAKGT